MYTAKDLVGKTVEELAKLVIEQQDLVIAKEAALKTKQGELDLTVQVNDELTAKVAALSKNAPANEAKAESQISDQTFKSGNTKYGFSLARVFYKGNTVTSAEVLASKDLQAELVAMKSGMIYEIA